MDIGKVLQSLNTRLSKVERSPRLSHASIDDTSVEVRDSTGSLRGLLGMQADGTTTVNVVNGPPPPQPSAPIVASVLGGVTVSWDGLFADGSPLPLDWARVEVHASILASYSPIPATLQGTIETAQGATVVVPCDTDVYVRLVARTTSGTASTPSVILGPYGPTPVVADDILDGIVTTVKLADDAVTQAKVAVGAIGSTEISDNAVTTPKIVAGAVQTAQLDALAVNASKIAAGAVTTAKLDTLAVTADKIAANAIVVGKIAAGAVDATAIAADAITGKTITGGTITGALIQTDTSGERIVLNEDDENKIEVYDATRVVVELSALGLGLIGSAGAAMVLDPNATYPNIRLTNAAQTNQAVINVSEGTAGAADLGLNSGKFTVSSLDWKWRTYFGNDFWVAERVRDGASSTNVGGRITLFNDRAVIGYNDTTNATEDTSLYLYAGLAQLVTGRMEVYAPASSSPALFVNAASGHTGSLQRLLLNGAEKFLVDKDGNVTAAGNVTSTPVTTTSGLSAGSGFTTNNFYGYKVGKIVVIDLYMNRSGSTITATTGNITPDVAIATLPAGWRPTHSTINGHWDDGTASGGWVVGTDGVCTLRTASSDIANNRNLRLHITFIQD